MMVIHSYTQHGDGMAMAMASGVIHGFAALRRLPSPTLCLRPRARHPRHVACLRRADGGRRRAADGWWCGCPEINTICCGCQRFLADMVKLTSLEVVMKQSVGPPEHRQLVRCAASRSPRRKTPNFFLAVPKTSWCLHSWGLTLIRIHIHQLFIKCHHQSTTTMCNSCVSRHGQN